MSDDKGQRVTAEARLVRYVAAGILAAGLACAATPITAHADPALPNIPPYIPDVPYPYPGSYLYPYNLIPVYGPAINDARGIRATATADPAMTAEGMPGSQLGPAANKTNVLGTYSNMKNDINAGPAPDLSVQPGISPGAGNQMPVVEDPRGIPPASPSDAESTQPTGTPAVPGNSQVLESPDGRPPNAGPAPPSSSASAPPAAQVWPQTPGFAPGAFGTGPGPGISAGQ